MTTQTKAQRLSKEWFAKITLFRRVELGGEMAKEMRRLDKIEAEWAALSQDDGKAQREIDRLEAANAELLEALISISEESTDKGARECAMDAIKKHGGAA